MQTTLKLHVLKVLPSQIRLRPNPPLMHIGDTDFLHWQRSGLLRPSCCRGMVGKPREATGSQSITSGLRRTHLIICVCVTVGAQKPRMFFCRGEMVRMLRSRGRDVSQVATWGRNFWHVRFPSRSPFFLHCRCSCFCCLIRTSATIMVLWNGWET